MPSGVNQVQSFSRVWLLWPRRLQPTSLLCPWGFPCKNTGVGCHFPLQGIFPAQPRHRTLISCITYCISGGFLTAESNPRSTTSHRVRDTMSHRDRGATSQGQRCHVTGTEVPRHGDRGATSRGNRGATSRGQRCHVTGPVQPRTDSEAVSPGLSAPQGCCLLLSYDQIDLSTPGPTPLIYSPFRYFCHFKNVIYLESWSEV